MAVSSTTSGMPGFRLPLVNNSPQKVQLARVVYVRYSHPDLKAFDEFAGAFGLIKELEAEDCVYYRGYGQDKVVYVAYRSEDKQRHFLGPAFLAQSRGEFNKATKIPGAVVSEFEGPGGGQVVDIVSPTKATTIRIIFGQAENAEPVEPVTATHKDVGPFNLSLEKKRKGRYQRYHEGPAMVHKLGHLGYNTDQLDLEFEFYTTNFNFYPSDILWSPEQPDMDIMTFLRLDLGDNYTDHHTLFLAREPPGTGTCIHHSSFEVEDFDTQLLGHQWLAKKGYESVWGVGRHILGSQIFDYWKDCDGFRVEHYADGDLVNQSAETERSEAGPLSIWGPEMPKTFLTPDNDS